VPPHLRPVLILVILAVLGTAGAAVAGFLPAASQSPAASSAIPAPPSSQAPSSSPERHDHHADAAEAAATTPPGTPTAADLVAGTLAEAARWADIADARAAGYRSIGDGATGYEHLVHPARLLDPVELDPTAPESLVYRVHAEGHEYVSAMYVLRPGATMADVPDLGDDAARWHVHDDLCFSASGTVAGRVTADGCRPGGTHVVTPPMLHVWVVDHPCGRFAPLEGHGGHCEHDH
jgi:hypothetical protein